MYQHYCSCIHNSLTHGHESQGIQYFADLCTLNFVRFKGVSACSTAGGSDNLDIKEDSTEMLPDALIANLLAEV